MTTLIVALDAPSAEEAERVLDATSPYAQWYKVGYEAFYGYGSRIIGALHERSKSLFLDLKLHDIPQTVAAAVTTLGQYRPALLTVHADGGYAMLAAAAAARDQANTPRAGLKLAAVTLLTSLSKEDLAQTGVVRDPHELVSVRAELAARAGIDAVVCAVEEVAIVRGRTPRGFLTVCPGIRPQGQAAGDQRRVATPLAAALAGADFIVVGRPIAKAADPAAATAAIAAELASASSATGGSGALS